MRLPPAALAALAALAACTKAESPRPSAGSGSGSAPAPEVVLLGVEPTRFRCDTLATEAALATALGGAVKPIEPQFTPPRGVAAPCTYAVERPAPAGAPPDASPRIEAWTFDLDCRPDFEKRADALFAQYERTSAELVQNFEAEVKKAGKVPVNDAGVAAWTPEGSRGVQLGRRALDHHGQGLLFVDDDAPCYVRVVGPDAARRMALAQLVAGNLKEANAPMPPHAKPVLPPR